MKKYPVLIAILLVVVAASVMVYKDRFGFFASDSLGLVTQQTVKNTPSKSGLSADLNVISERNTKRLTDGCLAGVDCAVPINNPKFVSAKYARFLTDDDLVVGIVGKNQETAFPVKILAWHQVVSTTIDSKKVIVSFSPLTSSVGVFFADLNGKEIVPAVSAKILNNNAIFYDSATKSFINQFDGVGLTGPLTGQKLQRLPANFVTWKDWKKKYPSSLVLALPEDKIDYNVFPFEGYIESPTVNFPVENEDTRLPGKEIVYAFSVGEKLKAYPLSEMKKMLVNGSNNFSDIIGDVRVKFSYEDGLWRITNLQNNEEIIPYISYWFAFAAFNPKTDLGRAADLQPMI